MKTRLFTTRHPLLDVRTFGMRQTSSQSATVMPALQILEFTGSFGTSSSARRIQFTSHFKGIKEEDGAQEVAIGFPSSDDAEESTVARYNATVAELAHLCHCLKTQSFSPSRFHLSQLTQLPFEWPMARLSIDFPSVASSFAQNVSRLAVERTLSGQRLTETWA